MNEDSKAGDWSVSGEGVYEDGKNNDGNKYNVFFDTLKKGLKKVLIWKR